jgi:hypothetical protein
VSVHSSSSSQVDLTHLPPSYPMVVPVSPQTEPTMWSTFGKPPPFHDQSSLYRHQTICSVRDRSDCQPLRFRGNASCEKLMNELHGIVRGSRNCVTVKFRTLLSTTAPPAVLPSPPGCGHPLSQSHLYLSAKVSSKVCTVNFAVATLAAKGKNIPVSTENALPY